MPESRPLSRQNERDVLSRARAVIAVPDRWTQKFYARRADGGSAQSWGPDAVAWCALGALDKVTNDDPPPRAERALQEAAKALGFTSIATLNDQADHDTVLAAYDRAIEALS